MPVATVGRVRLTRLAVAAVLTVPLGVTTASAGPGPDPLPISVTTVLPAPALALPDPREAFPLVPDTVIVASGPAATVAGQLATAFRPATGFALPVVPDAQPGAITVRLTGGDSAEGYRLDIGDDGVELSADRAAGLFYGVQTLRQLLPPEIDAATPQDRDWVIPGGHIVDAPRFAYRGAMLDLARHFHTPDEIRRYIDQISHFKVNHLHLHLADDQGWRIQIDSRPRLTAVGGAPGTGVRGIGGGYLTKDDYRTLVAYAADRHVTIVPEIDMPGHVNAAQVAYPELTCDGVAPRPRTDIRVGYSSLCIGTDATRRFVTDVVRELAAMTPGPYLHIGGDEAHSTAHADYLAFEEWLLPLVAEYGKIPFGWQEIAQTPAARDAVVQYWNHEGDPGPTVASGAQVVLSPADKTYLDMQYDLLTPGGLHWAGTIEVDEAYDWDPAGLLHGVPEDRVLGVEAPLWSETLTDLADIEFQAFPRLPAIAELGWSPRATHDWESFRARLGAYGPRWKQQNVRFYESPQLHWS